MSVTPNAQQRAAIDARGHVFVAAGAGTGKTAVLVERFVQAVLDDGLDVDSLLVITYTERAAGELRARIRSRLIERGRSDLALELDNAWISTIHGFCRRLLGAHPLAAGIDPGFRVLDEPQALVLQAEAFTTALERFCAADEPDRWQLLATYGAAGLRRMLVEVYATLRSAGRDLVLEPGARAPLAERVESLREAAQALLDDTGATPLQRGAGTAALELLGSATLPERLLSLADLKPRGLRAAGFSEARDAVVAAALEELAARDRSLLQELLNAFEAAYAEAKARESALDFEDLQLRARDLLRSNDAIRERERERFRSIMVDEFQDTNRLQTELLDLLSAGAGGDVLLVGDEFQSIYGFRHADVAVFRERREAASTVLPLTLNHRSRPEVLAAVNELFRAEFGDEFQALEPADARDVPALRNAFELLVTDKAAAEEAGVQWRRSEARHVARRVRELVDAGDATPGEIVLLFAAGTDAEWFEEELRAVGLPTYRAAGRNYFGQQQVVDLLAYLRLLHNRYDDEALLTVLASPFVGVSNDALVLVRAEAQRQPIFRGLERSLPGDLTESDRRLLLAFRQRYERLLDLVAAHVPLELLCERILSEHDYDLAILALPDGRRRYANLRKLARLARSYEELRGADLEGFVQFVAGQEAVGAKESDAVSEEEGADAVRLLTIHAAKGLEFKVVVVPDAGRSRPPVSDILALSDGRFGFKVAHPATGTRVSTESYRDVRDHRERAERAERLRLYYVAMTRAMERLIVSGSSSAPEEAGAETPIGWVLGRLGLADEAKAAANGPIEVERGRATVVLRLDRGQPDPPAAAPVEEPEPLVTNGGQLVLFEGSGEALPPPAPRLHTLTVLPEPPLHRVSRLSFSALSLFERCSYRYFAERVAGMRPAAWDGGNGAGPGLHATELGDAVHRLLERVDLADPRRPADLDQLVRGWYPAVGDAELEHAARLVDAYCDSPLARRIAALDGVRVERPFAFELDGVLLNGRLDVLWRDGPRGLVLDYKTNALEGREPEEIVDNEYRTQRDVYALACIRAGIDDVEVVYQFLEAPEAVVSARFGPGDVDALEAELRDAIARIRAGDFRPTPSPFACSGCPALDRVCAGPRLLDPEHDRAEDLAAHA